MHELEVILCDLLDCNRGSLYLDNEKRRPLSLSQLNRLNRILKQRVAGEALQYLTGVQEFMGLTFKVSPDVLIPRPETEILVEQVINTMRSFCREKEARILDVGTGSGNIAVSIAVFLKNARLDAVDISHKALDVALCNARLHHVEDRIVFRHADLFSVFDPQENLFDCIVSNPPYIRENDYFALPEDVRREPKLALTAGEDGLSFYRAIEKNARIFLKNHGKIFLEIGDDQAGDVCKIFGDTYFWKNISRVKDYNGIDRVIVIEKA